MSSADPQTIIYRRAPQWLHRLGNHKIILLQRGSEPKEIRGIAVAIWLILEEPATLAQLSEEVAALSPVATSASLDEALELLVQQSIIEPVQAS